MWAILAVFYAQNCHISDRFMLKTVTFLTVLGLFCLRDERISVFGCLRFNVRNATILTVLGRKGRTYGDYRGVREGLGQE